MTAAGDEMELVTRARSGDTRAYAVLVERHSALAFRLAYVITRSANDAEEAAQDGFVKAWKALDRFRDGAPFAPWVLHIVRNEARNKVRARGRRSRMQMRVAALPRTSADAAEDLALRRSTDESIAEAVDRLPEKLRNVVVCRYLLDLSESETATVLGVPPGTVKSRSASARTALATALEGIA